MPQPTFSRLTRLPTRTLSPQVARRMAWGIILLVSLMAASALGGFLATTASQLRLNETRRMTRELGTLRTALIDAETGVRGFVLTGRMEYLEPYQSGLRTLETLPPAPLAELDNFAALSPGVATEDLPSERLQRLRAVWEAAIEQSDARNSREATQTLQERHGKQLMDSLRGTIGAVMRARDEQAERTEAQVERQQDFVLVLNIAGAAIAIAALTYAFDRAIRDGARRDRAVREAGEARRQVEQLFAMTDMLQSATEREDANQVLRATAAGLLPDVSGALYVFNNSRDRLDLSTAWGADGNAAAPSLPDAIAPASCWALKRGKPHMNGIHAGALRCNHAITAVRSLEIPMLARGEVCGLLTLSAEASSDENSLATLQPIATALADAMSLALANISLRERLRNQALRDPLTGLYNRRFLEEMLERFTLEAERRHSPLAAVMVDLDHFKRLNDQFGHATGDAVLRQVANTVLAGLRGSDVACRYGGEELALLMPDCSQTEAEAKAEQLRLAIEDFARDGRLPKVTASFGVAALPEATTRTDELLRLADGALYQAKQQGRNRVAAAPCRPLTQALVAAA